MSLGRFFGYFGAKHKLAKLYPPPQHETIVEPFAGSAGYATRYHWHRVILVEKYPVVAALWRYLINVSAREIMQLPLLAPGQTVDELRVCPEAKTLIGFWCGDGDTSPRAQLSKWGRTRLEAGDEISQWGTYAVPATSYGGSTNQVAATSGASWFATARPLTSRHLGNGAERGRDKSVVCENDGATWLPFRPFRKIQGVREAGRSNSTEAIWTNGD